MTVVVAASGATRRAAVRSLLVGAGASWLVAPRIENARALLAEIAIERGAVVDIECMTLDGLAARLATPHLIETGLAIATPLSVDAAAARALDTLAKTLPRMGPLRASPGMPRAIARTLEELWAADLGAGQLAPFDDELARVAAEVERVLGSERTIPRARVLEHAVAAVHRGAVETTRVAFLDVPIATRLAADLARAIASRAARSIFVVPRADARTLGHLTGIEVEAVPEQSPTAALAGQLFAADRVAPSDDALEVIVARSEAAEAAEIARRVVGLARDGVPLHRVAIVLRKPELARASIEAAFQASGIPLAQRRAAKRPDPSGRALLALLTCAVDGLSARAFSSYLAFGVMPATVAGEPPPASADATSRAYDDDDDDDDDEPLPDALRAPRRWEALIVEAAVVGGDPARWRRRFSGLRAALERSAAQIDRRGGESHGVRRTIEDLAELERFALPLLDDLAALPERASLAVYAQSIGAIATRALARPTRSLTVLAELLPRARAETTSSLADVVRVLAPRLGSIEVRSPAGGVQLVTPDELRGASFDTVIVAGLAERVFPARVPEDPLLPDATRRPLSSDLEDAHARASSERLALALAVGAAERRVIALASITTAEGRPRVPSVYFMELLGRKLGRLASGADLAAAMGRAVGTITTPDAAATRSERTLATLTELARLPHELARGRAGHVVERNVLLRSALRRFYRLEKKELGRSDGLVVSREDRRGPLAAHLPSARPYSATALERFAKCPLQFYLGALLRLEPREEPVPLEMLDPLVRGSIFHEAQFHTLLALREAKLIPITSDRLELAMDTLARVTRSLRSELVDRLVPAIPRVFHGELDAIELDLREWLARLAQNADWQPRYFELAFGLSSEPGRDPASRDEPVALETGIHLRGAIDLVEESATHTLRATDHKTGSNYPIRGRGPLVVRGGQTLQPVLYALALAKLFPEARVEGGRLYYCTAKGGFDERTVPLDDEARAAATDVAHAVTEAATRSLFPALPLAGACEFCDQRIACGPRAEAHAERLEPKTKDVLPALVRLRGRV